jgi:hypothetical protein
MEYLPFSLLALYFGKNYQNLANFGLIVDLDTTDNLFKDTLTITFHENFTVYIFSIQHLNWNRYREFIMSTNISQKFVYRLTPISNDPIRIRKKYDSWSSDSTPLPNDLKLFGEEILRLILDLNTKVHNDKLSLDNLEFSP